VRALLDDPFLRALAGTYSRDALRDAARRALDRARERIVQGESASVAPEDVLRVLETESRPMLRRVVNATGVVLHTNLGRAPLAPEAVARMVDAAGYANLELRLSTGARGGRDDAVDEHVRALTGCEAAFAVNNGAAAALLALAALAAGREVIVSRGELVEIGGGFRVPEVLAQSGCRLVEVGTTNRTRTDDYRRAMGPATAALLRVHRSNFALTGFVEDAPMPDVAALAHEADVSLLYDQGTGDPSAVRQAFTDGADLVLFSGDKLLGGPQAGIVAGRRALVDAARRHPLARALRVDKLRLAALEATLALWRTRGEGAIPVQRMLAEDADSVRARAQAVAEGAGGEVVQVAAAAGGGTLPERDLPSFAVRLSGPHPDALAAALRTGEPAVVARVEDDAVLLDARTVAPGEIEELRSAIRAALAALSQAAIPSEAFPRAEPAQREDGGASGC